MVLVGMLVFAKKGVSVILGMVLVGGVFAEVYLEDAELVFFLVYWPSVVVEMMFLDFLQCHLRLD